MHGIDTSRRTDRPSRESPLAAALTHRHPFTDSRHVSVFAWSHAAHTDTSANRGSSRLLEDCFTHHPTVCVVVHGAAPRRRGGYTSAMSKRHITPDFTAAGADNAAAVAAKGKAARKRARGAPWAPSATASPPDATPLARHAYAAAQALAAELGRTPTAAELAKSLGIGVAAARALLDELAPLPRLTDGMRRCLVAIATLERDLGGSPSTRDVSRKMGLSPSAARFHINRLAAVGLVTPPAVRLVLAVTPAGRELLPPGEFSRSAGKGGRR